MGKRSRRHLNWGNSRILKKGRRFSIKYSVIRCHISINTQIINNKVLFVQLRANWMYKNQTMSRIQISLSPWKILISSTRWMINKQVAQFYLIIITTFISLQTWTTVVLLLEAVRDQRTVRLTQSTTTINQWLQFSFRRRAMP